MWSEPVNIGAPINSLAMECCIWLNDDETEIIFNTASDLDSDGVDEDLETRPTGNYIATRSDRNSPWNTPTPLPGMYGAASQNISNYRHDIHKSPSGNFYLWEKFANGDKLLVFGEYTGGTDSAPTYASPVVIEGSENHEMQLWVNDEETRLIFNHRQASGETQLYMRTRNSPSESWEAPSILNTPGFADPAGKNIWGESSFDHIESFMILARFNTSDSNCWTPELLYSVGDPDNGFNSPTVLNASK